MIFQSCTLHDAVVVQKLGFSGVAQPLRDARCAVVSDHSRCVVAPLVNICRFAVRWFGTETMCTRKENWFVGAAQKFKN